MALATYVLLDSLMVKEVRADSVQRSWTVCAKWMKGQVSEKNLTMAKWLVTSRDRLECKTTIGDNNLGVCHKTRLSIVAYCVHRITAT